MAKSLRTSEIPAWLKTFLEHQEDSRARQDEARETAAFSSPATNASSTATNANIAGTNNKSNN